MNMRVRVMLSSKHKISPIPRIGVTRQIGKHFIEDILKNRSIAEFSKNRGLSYTLIYNLAHARIDSLSPRNYRTIFREEPPLQKPERVDGTYFRDMAGLWIFLNDEITKSDLYLEFYEKKNPKKIDYRIFNGQTRTVETRIEQIMEKKFFDSGLDRQTLKKWIQEYNQFPPEPRVSYHVIRPVLLFLEKAMNVNPTLLLNQWFDRYETGKLKSVPQKIYGQVMVLKERTEKALTSGRRSEIEKLREEIYGKKQGLTLYSQVEEELKFLQKYSGKRASEYLGRSISGYEKRKVKRLATHRAQTIINDCHAFIGQHPDLPFLSIPKSYRDRWMNRLLSVLKGHIITILIQHEDLNFERHVLRPLHSRDEYKKEHKGLVLFNQASDFLGIGKKAFDLMVAKHCDLFRSVGTYINKWYLSDLYLKELSEKEFFDFLTAKYERMAKIVTCPNPMPACMN
jgi:hypothetical protein